MLTIEDVVEEILGEIEDEHDSEKDLEIKIDDLNYRFSARLEIDYLNDKYHFDLPRSEEYETLAGYVLNYFENIPKIDEIIDQDEFKIIIKEVDDRSVIKILLQIKN